MRAAEALAPRSQIRVVLVESAQRLVKRPYQRKKLVLLLSAMRHYAEELRTAGYTVDYRQAPTMVAGLRDHVAAWQPMRLLTMAAADYTGRQLQQERLAARLGLPVTVLPNTQLLTGRYNPYPAAGRKVIQEHFYREMRRHFGILVEPDGTPVGGQWNFDHANRQPLPKRGVTVPAPRRFPPDAITQAVMAEVAQVTPAISTVHGFDLAVMRQQAASAVDDFIEQRLANFGPYEDAMSSQQPVLFHSLLSPYLNIGLLEPLALARRVEAAYHAGVAPLNSAEGFTRQIIGWREYLYWCYWRQMPGLLGANGWHHTRPLPAFFWDAQTDLACLRQVIGRVIDQGYSHHIERLMVLCNFCVLAGIDPRQVNEWFLSFYIDAYEWVVTPNVIGMGLNADGGQIATKPYIASANYIQKMSDYCTGCRYQPKQRTGETACPFNYLYWNFLLQNEAVLRANPRFGPAVLGLRTLSDEARQAVRQQAAEFLGQLTGYGEFP